MLRIPRWPRSELCASAGANRMPSEHPAPLRTLPAREIESKISRRTGFLSDFRAYFTGTVITVYHKLPVLSEKNDGNEGENPV